jgi:hypothetical protein
MNNMLRFLLFGFPHLPFSCNGTKGKCSHIYYKTIHNCFLFLLSSLSFTANFISFLFGGISPTSCSLLLFLVKPYQGPEKLVYRWPGGSGLTMFTTCSQAGLRHKFCNVPQNEALQNNKCCLSK